MKPSRLPAQCTTKLPTLGLQPLTALTQEHTRMQALIDLFQDSDLVKDLLRLVGIADLAMLTRVPRGDELN